MSSINHFKEKIHKISRTNSIILSLIIIISISTMLFASSILQHHKKLWQEEYTSYQQKKEIIAGINEYIGYGMYIHNFKNSVLRRDQTLFNNLDSQVARIFDLINQYSQLENITLAEKQSLEAIEHTFKEYQSKHSIIQTAINESWPATKTDALVKVDDSKAVAALSKLKITLNAQFEKVANAIDKKIDLYSTYEFVFLISTILLLLLVLFTYHREKSLLRKALELKSQLNRAEQYYKTSVDSVVDSIIITNKLGQIESCNPATLSLFGYEQHDLIGQNVTILMPEGQHKTQHANYMNSSEKRKKTLAKGRELFGIKKSKQTFPIEITITPFEMDEETKFVGVIKDISERYVLMKSLNSAIHRLSKQATIDSLTGLNNRHSFNDYKSELLQSVSETAKNGSIIMMDIDYFKKINDTYGHVAGDEALKVTANLISSYFSQEDNYLCRLGGEEFLGFIFDKSEAEIQRLAEDILNEFRNLVIHHNNERIHLTLSLGILNTQLQANHNLDDLIDRADKALYQAKNQGRNKFVLIKD